MALLSTRKNIHMLLMLEIKDAVSIISRYDSQEMTSFSGTLHRRNLREGEAGKPANARLWMPGTLFRQGKYRSGSK